MRSMTITQALVELKLLDSRIGKAITDSTFVSCGKTNYDKTVTGALKKDVSNEIKASYQKVLDLIRTRAAIKSAIVLSNASTTVTINDTEMTVAEAIEYKSSITYDRQLLLDMKRQFSNNNKIVESKNIAVDEEIRANINKYIENENPDPDKIKGISDPIREAGEFSLIDPIDIKLQIQRLEDNINEFMANVDIVLSVSNATTIIEVED